MRNFVIILSLSLLTACNISDRLSRVGRAPDLKEINTHEDVMVHEYPGAGREEVSVADAVEAHYKSRQTKARTAGSIWRGGERAFFRDSRARSVGDIIKVAVTIQDQAKLDNKTETTRNDRATTGVPNLLGFEQYVSRILPESATAANLINVASTDNNSGQGKIDRKETIQTTIAVTVIKILPSSNLIIKGTQEVRVNNELREVTLEGIVRPEDISSENSVALDQVAEARVSYGGRGIVSDYQQPRYGKQVLDIVAPF